MGKSCLELICKFINSINFLQDIADIALFNPPVSVNNSFGWPTNDNGASYEAFTLSPGLKP
jgi:hypothetical protein